MSGAVVYFLALIAAPSSTLDDGASITLLPARITLSGSAAKQRLVVERIANGRFLGEFIGPVELKSGDSSVAAVENGVVRPLRNGRTTLTARGGDLVATAEVVVDLMEKPAEWSFRNHVQSVLTKQGCNSGACHGAIAGKNGFRLSLRGFNADGDYAVLTRQARGRRVDVQDPGRSLALLKPTGAVSHGGGKRLEIGGPEYQVVADWIAAGANPPQAGDARIERLEMLPATFLSAPGSSQQILVRAFFSDGRAEDVTRWAKYSSTNAEAAQVDESGLVKVVGFGEGAVTAWYLNKLAVATVSAPYPNKTDPAIFAKAERRSFIDEMILEKLQALNLPPSAQADDGEFLRRASIDVLGTLPTAEETRAFLGNKSPTKRDALIDRLLEQPEFIDYWSYRWSDLLLVNSEKLRPAAMWAYYRWIRRHVAGNTPWDEFVRELVVAQGSTLENGATNFFVLHPDPMELTETISTAFMGMPLNCCRCHNHPLEKWTNDQYFGFLNLVSRVRQKSGDAEGEFTVFAAPAGDVVQPLSGKVRPPQPLDGAPLGRAEFGDRRKALAAWLTAPENPYFTRSIANRIWADFMGVGLVEKVDDLRLTNPASNERLLGALAAHLVDNHYNLKSLMRVILRSAAYQRSSVPLPGNKDDRRFYSRFYPRRLIAEVLLDGLSQQTGAPTQFPNYPGGWRALQLPDSNVASYFLEKFGRPDRTITCDCERTSEPSMVQVLHLSNGDVLNKKLQQSGNRIDRQSSAGMSIEQIIEDLYLSALSRRPSRDELARLQQDWSSLKVGDRRAFLEDLYWSVLSSKEFLFNR